MRQLILAIATVIALSAMAVAAQPPREQAAAPAAQSTQTGSFELTFTERTRASAMPDIARRIGLPLEGIRRSGQEPDYDLAAESFAVHVPESYTADVSHGLLVWISPGDPCKVPPPWLDVLDKRKIIWVGANRSGNERAYWCRVGLAIDAAEQMSRLYNIDPKRVYISGLSGGGRVGSILGICYPEIFQGGLYIIGSGYYRNLPVPDQPGRFYPKLFSPPGPKFLTAAKKQSRHVLLTGETDFNRPSTQASYQAMKKDGFDHVTYIEVPGMGHQMPDAVWFEKAMAALDDLADAGPKQAQPRP